MRFEIEFRPAEEEPTSLQANNTRAALLLNPCDGFHHVYARWVDGHFTGFTAWASSDAYEPGRHFIAWALLPDEVTLIEDMQAIRSV